MLKPEGASCGLREALCGKDGGFAQVCLYLEIR